MAGNENGYEDGNISDSEAAAAAAAAMEAAAVVAVAAAVWADLPTFLNALAPLAECNLSCTFKVASTSVSDWPQSFLATLSGVGGD